MSYIYHWIMFWYYEIRINLTLIWYKIRLKEFRKYSNQELKQYIITIEKQRKQT